MKKTMLFLALLITAVACLSQTAQTDVRTKDYYVNKSKHQKTAAWIMLGGGVVITGLGLATTAVAAINNSNNGNTLPNVLAVVGLASTLGNIPVFISAAHNKRKAAEVAFNMQKLPVLTSAYNRAVTFQPTCSLKISL